MTIKNVEEAVDFALEVVEGYNDGTGEFKEVEAVLAIVEQTLRLVRVKFSSEVIQEFLQDDELVSQLNPDDVIAILNKLVTKE